MIIAIDFDGTIVTHEYPAIGKPVEGALPVMKQLIAKGHKIILYTMRSGRYLEEAVRYVNSAGIDLYGINHNPAQDSWTDSPKAYAQLYIDDAALGCPLIYPGDSIERPWVDWSAVQGQLADRGII